MNVNNCEQLNKKRQYGNKIDNLRKNFYLYLIKAYKRYYLGSLIYLNYYKLIGNKSQMQDWKQKHKLRYKYLQQTKYRKNLYLQGKEWIESNEFKEKYLDTNHSYPPLVNPDNINYELITADLIQYLNLIPHIRNYFTQENKFFVNYIQNERIGNPLDIDSLIKNNPQDIFISWKLEDFAIARFFILKPLVNNGKVVGLENIENFGFERIKFLLGYGIASVVNNIQIYLEHKNKPILFYEDSYLSCITLMESHKKLGCDIKFEYPRSFFLDDLGQHFNVFQPSRLELMLNDKNLIVTDKQKQEARKLIDFIVKNKLSKYNNQPIYKPIIGNQNRKKVLVIEQCRADYSIYMSGANDEVFDEMLQSAISENPNCDIIIKRHPEAVLGFNGGYYNISKAKKNIYPINITINPYSLLEIVDKVYVCSSTLGLEATMAGKEVHLFSCPSYAGWGFTKDRKSVNRRKHKRSIEEFVYITYFKYARYVNEQGFCSIWEVADTLLKLRNEYFELYGVRNDDL